MKKFIKTVVFCLLMATISIASSMTAHADNDDTHNKDYDYRTEVRAFYDREEVISPRP
jgi:hypothetical protein